MLNSTKDNTHQGDFSFQKKFLSKRVLSKWLRETDLHIIHMIFVMWLFSLLFASKVIIHSDEVDIDKHLTFLVISIFIVLFCSFLTIDVIIKSSYIALPLLGILLLATLSDTFGQEYNNSYRSFFIPFLNIPIQPSVLIAPFFAVCISRCLAIWRNDDSYLYGFIAFLITISISIVVYLQPDFDTACLFIIYSCLVLLLTGIWPSLRLTIIISVIILSVIAVLIYFFPHVINRVYSFFYIMNDDSHSSIVRRAIENGGWIGYDGKYSPYPYVTVPQGHNDVVLASIIQEFGLLGSLIPLSLLGLFFCYTLYSINQLKELSNILSSLCLLLVVSVPSFIHIAVTFGFLPILGQNLLLTSTGGSTLISNAVSVGFLLVFLKDKIASRNLEPTIIQ